MKRVFLRIMLTLLFSTMLAYVPSASLSNMSPRRNISAVKASSSTYQGDLILSGNNVTTIQGRFDINGSIIVEGNATLILQDAIVNLVQSTIYEHNMTFKNPVNGNPRLQSSNSIITSNLDHWFEVLLLQNSSATIFNSTDTSYLKALDDSVASISNSTIRFVHVERARVSIVNSTISYCLLAEGSCVVSVSNSTILGLLDIESRAANCSIAGLGAGFFTFWDYRANCSVVIAPYGQAPNVTLRNTAVEHWQFAIHGSSSSTITDSKLRSVFSYSYAVVQVVNSTVDTVQAASDGRMALVDSTVSELAFYGGDASYLLSNCTLTQILFLAGDGYIAGNATFKPLSSVDFVSTGDLTRNFNVIVEDAYGESVSNATLVLKSEDQSIVWSGVTDIQGSACFNLAFTDANYTDTLKLEAVKEEWFASNNIALLSDTPVIVQLPGMIYVDDDNTAGPWHGTQEYPFQNITSALEHAIDGSIIFVCNGTYYENVVVNNAVSLVGESRGSTVVDGGGIGSVIYVGSSGSHANITGFTVRNGSTGIQLYYSSYCNITNSMVTSNDIGIDMGYVYGSTFSNNTIRDNRVMGIHCGGADQNEFCGNIVVNNYEGVVFWGDCDHNVFVKNFFIDHYNAHVALVSYSDSNHFYHNNFINGTINQVYIFDSYNNVFDNGYPSGGNYWDDYSGVDLYRGPYQSITGSDGIGDTPHIIDESNMDSYPLMGPLGPLTMIGEDITVFPTNDVCLIFENVTSAGLTVVNKTAAGPEPPSGFMVDQYYRIETSANCSGKITIRIVYDDSNMTQEQEENLRLMQWDEMTQEWMDITTYIDTENNVIIGETSHLSMFGVTRALVLVNYVTITEVTPSKTIVGEDYSVTINVTIANQGDIQQTFNITVYANDNAINSKNVTLASGNYTTITFTWNTTGFGKRKYTVSAHAAPVPGETATADNTLVADGEVCVTIPGDVDGDFDVDLYDAVKLLVIYGVKKDNPSYDPNCDIDGDGDIDLYDAVIMLTHYGQKYHAPVSETL